MQSVGLPTNNLRAESNGYMVIDWQIPEETDFYYSLALSPIDENMYITAEIVINGVLIEKRYFHKDNLYFILKQFKNNLYEYDFDKINDLIMINLHDFGGENEFCGVPVEYDHKKSTETRRYFSVEGMNFEVTHLKAVDQLSIVAYADSTNEELKAIVTDIKWSSVHGLLDSFLHCRGVK